MALAFSEATTDNVNCGSDASLDNLSAGSALMWTNIGNVANSFRYYWGKNVTTPTAGMSLNRVGANGTLARLIVRRASTNQRVDITGVTTGWNCLACTWDTGGSPVGYRGTLTSQLADVSASVTNGAGALNDDSGNDWHIGNSEGGAFAAPQDVARFMLFNTVLTLAELQQMQSHPYAHPSLVLWVELGLIPHGTGSQLDLSGNGNNGTVTGATQADHASISIPIFHLPRYKIEPAAVVAAGGPKIGSLRLMGVGR